MEDELGKVELLKKIPNDRVQRRLPDLEPPAHLLLPQTDVGRPARVAGWGGDAAPLGGEEIHRRRMQCLRGQAELLPDGGPLAALGCAPEEVEGEAAWRRRGRPGTHLGEQPGARQRKSREKRPGGGEEGRARTWGSSRSSDDRCGRSRR